MKLSERILQLLSFHNEDDDLAIEVAQLEAENKAWRQAGEDAVKQLGSIVGLMDITALLIGGDDA
jgi:hypothetical protein